MSKPKKDKSGSMSRQQIKDRIDRHELDLSMCELSIVPVKDLVLFPKVTVLDLSCNLLSELPEQFGELRHLIHLDLSKNNLAFLPQSFGRLDLLKKLDLYSNQISSLPLSFSQLTDLKWLDVKGNPLDSDLSKVAGTCTTTDECQKCAKNVLMFMRSAAAQTERDHQDRLDRQRQAELRQRKIDAEKVAELRRQKQLEKQQRREKHEKERQQQQEGASVQRSKSASESTGDDQLQARSSKRTDQPASRSCLCYFFILLFIVLLGLGAGFVYCSQEPSTCDDLQVKITNTATSFVQEYLKNTSS